MPRVSNFRKFAAIIAAITLLASTAAEARAAGELAREVDGVKSVDNQLQVKK